MKMNNNLVLATLFVGAACGVQAQQIPADAAAAMAQAMAALGQVADKGAASGAIDTKDLKALLPEKEDFAGFKRVKAGVESNVAMGFKVIVATAEFKALDEGDANFSVQYSDIGGLNAFAKMAMAIQEVDEETENGFRRTTTYSGCKALEEYDGAAKSGKIQIFAGDRITVEVDGHDMSFEALKKVVDKIDLKKLAALKATTVAPAVDKK